MRNLGIITEILTLSALANANSGYKRHCEPRPGTSNIGGGKPHNGMYSQPKKLRKGAGKKKLTRAQRKRLQHGNS